MLTKHGVVRPQMPDDWTGLFVLPDQVRSFYQEVGPVDITIESYGNPFFLPRLAALWKFQAGYRWNGLTGEPINDWNDDWLVIADQGGDPFIVSRPSGRVLYDVHGSGVWEPVELFSDLNTMAACLAHLGSVVVEAADTFTDEECLIRSEHRKKARTGLRQLLNSQSEADLVLAELWG